MSESFPPQENEKEKNHVKSWTEANQAQDWFLKTFFSMPRPRRDGSTLTYFWLKCFITMALQFKEWNFLKYLKLWLTKNTAHCIILLYRPLYEFEIPQNEYLTTPTDSLGH